VVKSHVRFDFKIFYRSRGEAQHAVVKARPSLDHGHPDVDGLLLRGQSFLK